MPVSPGAQDAAMLASLGEGDSDSKAGRRFSLRRDAPRQNLPCYHTTGAMPDAKLIIHLVLLKKQMSEQMNRGQVDYGNVTLEDKISSCLP